jgi:hypothetical protein
MVDWKTPARQALHVSGFPETLLETARRHERVTRQEAMVAELARDNHPDAATLAREVLKTMRSSLDLMKRHLRAVEERKT